MSTAAILALTVIVLAITNVIMIRMLFQTKRDKVSRSDLEQRLAVYTDQNGKEYPELLEKMRRGSRAK